MMQAQGPSASGASCLVGVVARWLLGLFFVYMGLTKALHPEVFLKQVHEYHVVGNPFILNLIAAGLPGLEVFCGLLLVIGIAVRGAALVLVLMLVPFTALVVHRALALAPSMGVPFWLVKFDCGCGTGEVVLWRKVAENTFFLLLALWLLSGAGRRLALCFSVFGRAPGAFPPTPLA